MTIKKKEKEKTNLVLVENWSMIFSRTPSVLSLPVCNDFGILRFDGLILKLLWYLVIKQISSKKTEKSRKGNTENKKPS